MYLMDGSVEIKCLSQDGSVQTEFISEMDLFRHTVCFRVESVEI